MTKIAYFNYIDLVNFHLWHSPHRQRPRSWLNSLKKKIFVQGTSSGITLNDGTLEAVQGRKANSKGINCLNAQGSEEDDQDFESDQLNGKQIKNK